MDISNKVLIIDDEKSLLLGLSVLMKRSGYQIVTAENGKDGLRLAKEELPDIIVCDVMMPPPNGFELRKLLSEYPKTANIPFIFLTARTDQRDKVNGITSGADDYITKPFHRQELIARVEAVLRRSEIGKEKGRQEMKLQAEVQLKKLKSELLQNFHHELRTPLANIFMPLEIVMSSKIKEPEDQIRFIEIALSNTNRLHGLIEDLILLTNIDLNVLNRIRQEIRLEYDFYEPIKKRFDFYLDKDLEVNYDVQVTGTINAPRNEFQQVVRHLVDNAMKFSPVGGRVHVGLFSTGDGGFRLVVSDEGPGIPEDIRDKVFEKFYQGSQGDTREHEGLGAGLFIARSVARSLGGKVNILKSPEGCEVEFTIPPVENIQQVEERIEDYQPAIA